MLCACQQSLTPPASQPAVPAQPGATFVLVPGLACDRRLFAPVLAAFAAAGLPAPVAVDHDPAHQRIEDMAATLLARHAGPLVIGGASMGGMVAMEAARQAPQRVQALALLGTNARPETEDMRALRTAAIELFAAGRTREVIEANVGFALHADHAADPVLRQAYLDLVLSAPDAVFIHQNRAVMARPDARPLLDGFAGPVLVLCGDSDQLTPPECSHEIAQRARQAELHLIARCGHMLTLEQPAEVSAQLVDWWRRISSARSD